MRFDLLDAGGEQEKKCYFAFDAVGRFSSSSLTAASRSRFRSLGTSSKRGPLLGLCSSNNSVCNRFAFSSLFHPGPPIGHRRMT